MIETKIEGLEEERNFCMHVLEPIGYSDHGFDRLFNNWMRAKSELIKLFDNKLFLSINSADFAGEEEERVAEDIASDFIRLFARQITQIWSIDFDKFNNPDVNKRMFTILRELKIPYNNFFIEPSLSVTVRDDNAGFYTRRDSHVYFRIQDYARQLFDFVDDDFKISGIKYNKFLKDTFPYLSETEKTVIDSLWSTFTQGFSSSTGELILSVKLSDFLLMSIANSWSSCHRIYDPGECASGPVSYALDEVTAIAFKPNGKVVNRYNVSDLPDKSWRMICHLDLKNGAGVFGRQYPSKIFDYGKAIRSLAMNKLADNLGVKNTWTKKNGCPPDTLMSSDSTAYDDTGNSEHVVQTKLKAIDFSARVFYGASPICPECGHTHSFYEDVRCEDCSDSDHNYCEHCGNRFSGEVYYYGDDPLCGSCYTDNYFSCERCHEICHNDNSNETGHNVIICDGCFEDTYTCIICDEAYFPDEGEDDNRGDFICDSCLSNDEGFRCSVCEMLYNTDMESDTAGVCEDCSEDTEVGGNDDESEQT